MGVFDSNFDERESHLRVLADQLFFTVEKNGDRFILKRTADVSRFAKVIWTSKMPENCFEAGNCAVTAGSRYARTLTGD